MDARSTARLAAVQDIYTRDLAGSGNSTKDLVKINSAKKLNKKIFERLIDNVSRETIKIDEMISQNLSADWKIGRLPAITKAILRAAISVLAFDEEKLPKQVVISEYVNIAGGFLDEKEVKFVNAILDKIAISVSE